MAQPSPSPNRPATPPLPRQAPNAAPGRNGLALASLLLGLLIPIVVVLYQIPPQLLPHDVEVAIGLVSTVLAVASVPGVIGAIVTGHLALIEAKRFAPQRAWRGFAITGLVLSYLSIVYVIWLVVQFFLSGKPLLE